MSDSQAGQPRPVSLDVVRTQIQQRRFSLELLRAVADLVLTATHDGVWLIDTEGRTTFVNERTTQMLGYGVEEMLGRSAFDFMAKKGPRITEQHLRRVRHGATEQHEISCLRKDGTSLRLLFTANPLHDHHGSYSGSLALLTDLSPMRNRGHALLAQCASLQAQVAALEQRQAALESIAYRDVATGLRNRRYFDERLAEEVARCQRHARRACILFMDLDGLKQINDQWGHAAGDELLNSLAHILDGDVAVRAPGLLRASDVAARYGGDEFAVLAPETELEGGQKLAARILERVAAAALSFGSKARVTPSISIGVAACPLHATSPDELVAAADQAMYRAKKAGGGRVHLPESA